MQPRRRLRPLRPGIWVGLCALGVFWLARAAPGTSWVIYGRRVYPSVGTVLGTLTGWIPFSVGELISVAAIVALLAYPLRMAVINRRLGATRRRSALGGVAAGLALAGWMWALSVPLYALNYARPVPEDLFGLPPEISPDEAAAVIEGIGARLNALRASLSEDEEGVVRMPTDLRSLDQHLMDVQGDVLERFRLPTVDAGRAKWQLFSPLTRRYATGMFMFATGEPTVVRPPYPGLLPSTAAHERAHMSGFAGEAEASFVGVLTTWHSDRSEIRYSGWLELWLELGGDSRTLHPGVLRDHVAIYEHFVATTGFEAPVVRRIHDAALKGVGESEGVASYDRVADLSLRYLARYGFPDEPAL